MHVFTMAMGLLETLTSTTGEVGSTLSATNTIDLGLLLDRAQELGQRAVWVLGTLLGLALALVLDRILNRRQGISQELDRLRDQEEVTEEEVMRLLEDRETIQEETSRKGTNNKNYEKHM